MLIFLGHLAFWQISVNLPYYVANWSVDLQEEGGAYATESGTLPLTSRMILNWLQRYSVYSDWKKIEECISKELTEQPLQKTKKYCSNTKVHKIHSCTTKTASKGLTDSPWLLLGVLHTDSSEAPQSLCAEPWSVHLDVRYLRPNGET